MKLTDAHCHLDLFEDPAQTIQAAKDAGVVKILTAGIDKKTNRIVAKLQSPTVDIALGIYPPEKELSEKEVEEEIAFIKKTKPKAIGEVGLDFSEGKSEHQEVVFRKMIALAKKLSLPLIIHSRKAEGRVLEILEEEQAKKVVLHCFCGKKKLVDRAVKNKFFFSIPANITRSEQFQYIVKTANINQLLTETDSPYLAPIKGEQNVPQNVIEAIKKIAEMKGFDTQETASTIFMNYQRLF